MQGQQGGGRCGQAVTRSAIASECWQIFREARPDAGSQPVGLHHESIVRGADAWSKAAIVKGNFRMRYWNMLFQTLGAAAVAPVLGSCASPLPPEPTATGPARSLPSAIPRSTKQQVFPSATTALRWTPTWRLLSGRPSSPSLAAISWEWTLQTHSREPVIHLYDRIAQLARDALEPDPRWVLGGVPAVGGVGPGVIHQGKSFGGRRDLALADGTRCLRLRSHPRFRITGLAPIRRLSPPRPCPIEFETP